MSLCGQINPVKGCFRNVASLFTGKYPERMNLKKSGWRHIKMPAGIVYLVFKLEVQLSNCNHKSLQWGDVIIKEQ